MNKLYWHYARLALRFNLWRLSAKVYLICLWDFKARRCLWKLRTAAKRLRNGG